MGILLNWKACILSELCNCNSTPAKFWSNVSKSSGHFPDKQRRTDLYLESLDFLNVGLILHMYNIYMYIFVYIYVK